MWIQVEDTVREHDKIFNLADKLGISDAHAVGLLVCLWTWVAVNAPDGDVTAFPSRAIAGAAKWDKAGSRSHSHFYEVLLETRLLEKREDGRVVVRNWDKRASMIMDYTQAQREKSDQRVRRYRERKKQQQAQECNVTKALPVTDVTPLPNHTIPDHTKPNQTIQPPLTASNTPPSPKEDDTEPEEAVLGKVCEEFSLAMHKPSRKEREQLRRLLGEYGRESLLAAIEDARGKGRSVNYLEAILASWQKKGKSSPAKKPAAKSPETGLDLESCARPGSIVAPSESFTDGPSFDLEEYEAAGDWVFAQKEGLAGLSG